VFTLNHSEKLIVELEEQLEKLPCYCFIPIVFFIQQQGYILSDSYLPDDMTYLRTFLTKGLNNELQLHPSITQNIGYLDNIKVKYDHEQAELEDKNEEDNWKPSPHLTYKEENYWVWVGSDYGIWRYNNLATWIYNDKQSNIIFEITPRYPNFFAEENEIQDITFNEWIKEYKPLLTRIISPEIAWQWIVQADKVIACIKNKWGEAESIENN